MFIYNITYEFWIDALAIYFLIESLYRTVLLMNMKFESCSTSTLKLRNFWAHRMKIQIVKVEIGLVEQNRNDTNHNQWNKFWNRVDVDFHFYMKEGYREQSRGSKEDGWGWGLQSVTYTLKTKLTNILF